MKALQRSTQRSTLSLALGMALAAMAGSVAPTAQAQQAPNIGDAVRQAQPVPPVPPKAPPLPNIGGAPIEPPMQTLPGGAQTVQVNEFAVVGNRVIASDTLLALVRPDQGKALSLAELDAIATRMTRHYRSNGYFVARAYIPAQEMSSGKLTIRVVEGNYGRFILGNKSLVRDDIVQGLLDDIKDRDIVSLDTLERAMLIINDTPGVKVVQADVMPGEKVGTSDFAISTVATRGHDGYVLLDNYGSAYTGKERLSFSADWNSPSGRGDRLSANGMITRNSGLLNGRLGYSTLLGTDGTRGEVALSRTTYKLDGAYAALDASGTANSLELAMSKPLKRTRNDSVELGFGLNYRDLKDDVGVTNTRVGKQITSLNASISRRQEHLLFGADGLSQTSASLSAGHLRFKDATAAALDASGADTQGSYVKLNLGASRISSLANQFTLTTSAKAQLVLNNKSLDGSERMSVAGANNVAAYPMGELSGDHAALLRAELVRPISPSFSASAFADYGWAKTVKAAVAGTDTSRKLGDVGLAVTGLANGLLLKVQLAHRVSGGAPSSESTSRTRILVQAGWVI